jgi:hypothetical protein
LAAVGDKMADVGDVGDEITSKKKVISSELQLFRRSETYVSVVPNMPSHHILFSFSIVLYFNEDYVCQKETESCCLCCKDDLF